MFLLGSLSRNTIVVLFRVASIYVFKVRFCYIADLWMCILCFVVIVREVFLLYK